MFSSKCAEVFCQSYEHFAIVCTDCNLKTNAFNEFVLHYQEIHCNLQPTIKREELQDKILKTAISESPNQAHPKDIKCPVKIVESQLNIKNEICQFEDEYEVDEKIVIDSDDDVPLQNLLKMNPLESSQLTCLKCGKKYSSRSSLRTHLRRSHPDFKLSRLNAGSVSFPCSHCPHKHFSSNKALCRHNRGKHQTSAEIKDYLQGQVEDDLTGTTNHTKPIEIVCTADITANESDIRTETYRFENENDLDEKVVSSSDDDWRPLQDISKKNPLENSKIFCPICDKKYNRRKSFRMHVRRCHPDFKMPRLNAATATTSCADCPGKTYSTRKALQRHRREQHATPSINNYQCPHCEKQFKTQLRVTLHMRCVHKIGKNASQLKRYNCTQCDRVYSEKYLLKAHEVRHTGVRNFICSVPDCGMAFYDVKSLGAHRRNVHVGIRKFVCDICGFSTKTSASLQSHLRTHTGEKPFKCDQCDKCFTTSAAVIEHKVIHTSHIRPHVCDVCGKAFARPKALYHHKPLHLGIKKFVCKICGKAYAQQAGLSAHKRQHNLDNFGEPL